MKRKGNRLLTDLLKNKVFSRLTLSQNIRIKHLLNRGLEWELSDWKLIILRTFFVKWQDY